MQDSTTLALVCAFCLSIMGCGMGISVLLGALLGVWFK